MELDFIFKTIILFGKTITDKPPPKGRCLGPCLLQGILTHMMVFVSLLHLCVPQALDMKASLHHSRLQTRLFVPCCQPGSTSSSCLHLDTHRNLWAHLIGGARALVLPYASLLKPAGFLLAPKSGKAPLPGLFSPAVLTTHTCPSAFTLKMTPPSGLCTQCVCTLHTVSHGSPHSLIPILLCSAPGNDYTSQMLKLFGE